jgi:hypothetical protein
MSKIKEVLEDLTVYELLDWYADELAGNWAPKTEVEEAYNIRNWYQQDVEKRYNITTEGFIEMMKMHSEYVNNMTDLETDEYDENWSSQAKIVHKYYRQAYQASLAA